MQDLADFARDHQPAYVPATNRVLAGFLTAGVYALVLVVASHHTPTPNRAAPSEQTPAEMAQEQNRQASPQNASPPQDMRQDMRRNTPQAPVRQQNAPPSLLERLFGPRDQTAAPVPGMAPAPGPGGQTASSAKPPSGAPGKQLASSSSPSAAPGTSGQRETANRTRDKPPACYDAAWARAVSNRVRRFFPARPQQAAGVATAHLVIRRSGWLNELEIARTSGNATLDAAAYAMLRKAQPLPRIPERISADRIDLEVPIAFGVAGDFKITITNCGR